MEFLSTWQFWLGIFIGAIVGFFVAALCAVSGRASREEERISDEAIYEAAKREEERRGGPEIEIATQGKPEDD